MSIPALGGGPAQGLPRALRGAAYRQEAITLERLIVVLKSTGLDFRDAYQVIREIRGGPLLMRADLKARWLATDPAAWPDYQTAKPHAEVAQTPVDQLIRERGWHRTAEEQGPSLPSVTADVPANQAYVAGLTTAEFQRLVTILGASAPAWLWDVRAHRGLRGLAERPAVARLNATRVAGTRLGAWAVSLAGMAVLWYVACTGTSGGDPDSSASVGPGIDRRPITSRARRAGSAGPPHRP